MWSIIEPSVGIIAGSLPSVRPLWLLLSRRQNVSGISSTTIRSSERPAEISRMQTDATSQECPDGSHPTEPSGRKLLQPKPFWPFCSWRRTVGQGSTTTPDMKEAENGGIWTRRSVEISTTVRRTSGPPGGLTDRTSFCEIKAERWLKSVTLLKHL